LNEKKMCPYCNEYQTRKYGIVQRRAKTEESGNILEMMWVYDGNIADLKLI